MEVSMSARALYLLSCVAAASAAPAFGQDYSVSIVRPTVLAKDAGVIAGTLPGALGAKSYYLAVDLRPGTLQSQLKVTANSSATRSVTLDVLASDATRKDGYYIKTSRNEQNEASRSFQIDASGTYNLRVTVEGPEAGRFCVLLGGSALPMVKTVECPADPASAAHPPAPRIAEALVVPPMPPRVEAAPPSPPPIARVEVTAPPPPPRLEITPPSPPPAVEAAPPPLPKTVEIVTTKCEERLRVASEVLFDFDKSAIRPEARPAIEYVARAVQRAGKPVLIEGHTDSIGSEAYNVRLSEQRALVIQTEIARNLVSAVPMESRGYGKSRPIADNRYPDGTDNPDGRQRNRRVEIVVHTCM
jgi:outer membrane protein OmpA-like peptidoglycan-associated protein